MKNIFLIGYFTFTSILLYAQTIAVSNEVNTLTSVTFDVTVTGFNSTQGIQFDLSYDNTILSNPTITNPISGLTHSLTMSPNAKSKNKLWISSFSPAKVTVYPPP